MTKIFDPTFQSGPAGLRPTSAEQDTIYVAEDTGVLSKFTDGAWTNLSSSGTTVTFPITLPAKAAEANRTMIATGTAAGHGPFEWVVENADVVGNAQTFSNPVAKWGWNIDRTSDATKPDLHLALEQDFWTNVGFGGGWHHQSEAHIEWTSPTGTTIRVFTAAMEWATGKANVTLASDLTNLTDSAGTVLFALGTAATDVASFRPFRISPTASAAQLIMDSPGVTAPSILLKMAGSAKWNINLLDADSFSIFDSTRSRYMFNLFAATAVIDSTIDMRAVPKWNDANLWQTTVGAAGAASALPATPTKYLRVLDNAGTALCVPAYARS